MTRRAMYSVESKRTAWSLAAALAVLAPFMASSCSLSPYGYLTEIDRTERSPRALDCGGCHVEIYAEFQASRHASAFIEPAFVEGTSQHSFQDCLGCHAPESIFVDGIPKVRSMHREEGVTCIACHFDGEVLAGPAPTSALAEPHPIAAERALYRSSELCGKCHEGTYREWQQAPVPLGADPPAAKKSCQECHMRPVTRTLTQATDTVSEVLVSFEEEFAGRKHTFDVAAIADLEGAFSARAGIVKEPDSEAWRVVVGVTSRIPHVVPTGDFGFRRATLTTEVLATDGSVLGRDVIELFKEVGRTLEPERERSVIIDLQAESHANARSAHITLTTGKRGPERIVLFEQTLALDPERSAPR